MHHRADIDGLRGVAVLAVVIFHAFPTALPLGFLGVDLFFVISGYLITGDIVARRAAGTFTLTDFYRRRARRLLPALSMVLVAVLALGALLLLPDEFEQVARHAVASAFFAQNVVLWREVGYFDPEAALKPLLHLWSLSIEEQFYALWPLVLIACPGAWRQRVTLILIASSLVVMFWQWGTPAAYYLPLARFWEILAGAALAISGRPFRVPFVSGRVLVSIGLISYPLYLWHWPLLAFLRILQERPGTMAILAVLAVSFMLATATYLWIEQPVRRHGALRPLLLSLLALVGATAAAAAAVRPLQDAQAADLVRQPPRGFARCGATGCLRDGDRMAIIGDSHAEMYFESLARARPSTWMLLSVAGCAPSADTACAQAMLDATASAEVVALAFRGRGFELGGFDGTVARLAGKRVILIISPHEPPFRPRDCVVRAFFERSSCTFEREEAMARQAVMRAGVSELHRRHPGLQIIDAADILCRGETCSAQVDGAMVYQDDNHLSARGAAMVARQVDATLGPPGPEAPKRP